jgi:hypothetical protein
MIVITCFGKVGYLSRIYAFLPRYKIRKMNWASAGHLNYIIRKAVREKLSKLKVKYCVIN